MWAEDSARGSLLRKFSRQCNNALSLTSQNVTEPAVLGHGWKPTVVIQGHLHHRIGALHANASDAPRFAQLYVYDPQHEQEEAQARLDWHCLPTGTSDLEKDQLTLLLRSLQGYLRVCNPYIQDFLLALEIAAPQVDHGHLIINADARPAGAHECRYNCPQGLPEVAILMDDEPGVRDVTLHLHGGGLQSIHDTHRSFNVLHYLLFFPDGDDSWNLSLTLSIGERMSAHDFYAFHLHQRDTD